MESRAPAKEQSGFGRFHSVRLDKLRVRNFRNIVSLDCDFPPEGVVLIGENGQGKTSLLEAIFYLVLFRSLRGARDRELVRFGTDGFFVAGEVGQRLQAGYEVVGQRKKVAIDGEPITRLGDALGRFTAVPLAPSDREIVTDGPGERRKFLDVLLSLGDKQYLRRLTELKAVLRQRNSALRMGKGDEAAAFDGPFATAAEYVTRTRREWVEDWRGRYSELCTALGERPGSTIEYSPRRDSPETLEIIREELAVTLDRDISTGSTGYGPHRHDIRILLDGKDLRHYGSGGQQRTAAIALRMLEAEVLTERTGERPVTMYDDIFAELDARRQGYLLDMIQGLNESQVIVTAPRESEVPKGMFDRPRWTINGGKIETG
jgi:DNA replication and repair protein RecF